MTKEETEKKNRYYESHAPSDRVYRTTTYDNTGEGYNRSHRPMIRQSSLASSSNTSKSQNKY